LAELNAVEKVYHGGAGEVAAVRGVTLRIETGELLLITGRSGSGKSTLLALLGGLTAPTRGQVRLQGEDLGALSDLELSHRRAEHIGFAFQFAGLLPTLNVFDNVRLATAFTPLDGVAAALRARELLRAMGLGARLTAWPDELSGGEQRRVALSRALLAEPDLLLADEPTGDLDADTEAEIMAILADKVAGGLTVVMVTHNLELASLATRHVTLRDGRLEGVES
jgi:ABC-type lipoprotein export system ATPase subunit